MKHRRTVTIEFEHVKVTTSFRNGRNLWCDLCGARSEFIQQVHMIDIEKLMQMQGTSIDCNALHFFHPTGSQTLVCLNSIFNGRNAV